MNDSLFFPTLEEGRAYLESYDYLPITMEILYDASTMVNIFLCLKDSHENAFLLESVDNEDRWGRYSFIAYDPKERIEVVDGQIKIINNREEKIITDMNPWDCLNTILMQNNSPILREGPKFLGGYLGYFGYDTVRYIERKLIDVPHDDLHMPDMMLFKCEDVIAFDHLTHQLSITINIPTQGDYEANYQRGKARAAQIYDEITRFQYVNRPEKSPQELVVKSNISKEEFMDNVSYAKERIVEGDIFQTVLSIRFEVDNPPEAFHIYRMLRSSNPSPYMYFIQTKDFSIAGASPEMLVNVENGLITTKPIAGTIRRGKDVHEDQLLEKILLNDDKEKAEHTMLVDLGRNDIGKIAKFGTVNVPVFQAVEKYSQLFHITSQVEGELQEDKTVIDALKAILPAGTLSGAPKVKAMELIDKLEKNKRGLYGGTIGYISFSGLMDTCIAIRTVLLKDNKAYIHAGAGIVHGSIPEKEYDECERKAKALLIAIREAGRL